LTLTDLDTQLLTSWSSWISTGAATCCTAGRTDDVMATPKLAIAQQSHETVFGLAHSEQGRHLKQVYTIWIALWSVFICCLFFMLVIGKSRLEVGIFSTTGELVVLEWRFTFV